MHVLSTEAEAEADIWDRRDREVAISSRLVGAAGVAAVIGALAIECGVCAGREVAITVSSVAVAVSLSSVLVEPLLSPPPPSL